MSPGLCLPGLFFRMSVSCFTADLAFEGCEGPFALQAIVLSHIPSHLRVYRAFLFAGNWRKAVECQM